MRIIKTKKMTVLLKGIDSVDLFSCYLRHRQKLNIDQLKCDKGWKFREKWKVRRKSFHKAAWLHLNSIYEFLQGQETGLWLVTDTELNPHYQSNTGRDNFSTCFSCSRTRHNGTEALWYTQYLCWDSISLLAEIDTSEKEATAKWSQKQHQKRNAQFITFTAAISS